nr:hypothetical protein [Bradyrhizobium liaoningense]
MFFSRCIREHSGRKARLIRATRALAALPGKIEASLDLIQTSEEADAKQAY